MSASRARGRRIVLVVWTSVVGASALLTTVPAPAEPVDGHLTFFRQNRDFVLRAFERLPQGDDAASTDARAWDYDPFAAWDASASVRAVRAALDTASAPEHLDAFRMSLGDLLDESDAAAARLDELDRLFRAHLRTALEVTLESDDAASVQRVEAWLDAAHVVDVTVSDAERAALDAGGVLEVLRQVVEPRAQQLELRIWLSGQSEPRVAQHVVEPVADALRRVHVRVDAHDPVVHVEASTLGGSR